MYTYSTTHPFVYVYPACTFRSYVAPEAPYGNVTVNRVESQPKKVNAVEEPEMLIEESEAAPAHRPNKRGKYLQYTEKDVANWVHLRRKGMSWQEIADETGFGKFTVRTVLTEAYPEVVEATRNKKKPILYTPTDFPGLLEFRAQGKTLMEIARFYGVSYSTIRNTLVELGQPTGPVTSPLSQDAPGSYTAVRVEAEPAKEAECKAEEQAVVAESEMPQTEPIKRSYPVGTKNKKEKNYLNNGDLLREILKSKEQDSLTKEAERMLVLLGERVVKKMTYQNGSDDRNDSLQEAYLHLFSNWRLFDPAKSTNAFAYFTEIVKRGLAAGWNKINKKVNGVGFKGKVYNIDQCVALGGMMSE